MNEFLIGVQEETLVFFRPVPQQLTRQQAINLSAWLAVLADPTGQAVKTKISEIVGISPILGAIWK